MYLFVCSIVVELFKAINGWVHLWVGIVWMNAYYNMNYGQLGMVSHSHPNLLWWPSLTSRPSDSLPTATKPSQAKIHHWGWDLSILGLKKLRYKFRNGLARPSAKQHQTSAHQPNIRRNVRVSIYWSHLKPTIYKNKSRIWRNEVWSARASCTKGGTKLSKASQRSDRDVVQKWYGTPGWITRWRW